MPYAKVIGTTDGTPTPHDGRWVVDWDPNTPFGELAVTSSKHRRQARRFYTIGELLEEWQTVSSVEPMRPDGEPNRPLTGVTIIIES